MDFHHEMRGELEPGQIGDGGDFQERGDTPNAGRVGLHEGHRAVTDQFRALGKTAEHLTARDGRVQPLREHGMSGVIVSTQGLFQPNQTQFIELASGPQRSGEVPLLVGICHHRHVFAHVFSDRPHACDVKLQIRLPNFQLDATEAKSKRPVNIAQHLVQ